MQVSCIGTKYECIRARPRLAGDGIMKCMVPTVHSVWLGPDVSNMG